MIVARQTLESLLLSNVLDLRFKRRIPKAGSAETRRMICTKSANLLQSVNGKIVLNYAAPKTAKQFNEAASNALVVWDVLMQDYRIVSADSVDVIREIPADDTFWEIFNNEIYPLSTDQKIQFMNS